MIDKIKDILENSTKQLTEVSVLLKKLDTTLKQLTKLIVVVNIVNIITLVVLVVLVLK